MSVDVRKIHELVDQLAKLCEEYRKTEDTQKRIDLLSKIMDIRTELELLLTQLTRI